MDKGKKTERKIIEYDILQNNDSNSLNCGDWSVRNKGSRHILRYFETEEQAKEYAEKYKYTKKMNNTLWWWLGIVIVIIAFFWLMGVVVPYETQ